MAFLEKRQPKVDLAFFKHISHHSFPPQQVTFIFSPKNQSENHIMTKTSKNFNTSTYPLPLKHTVVPIRKLDQLRARSKTQEHLVLTKWLPELMLRVSPDHPNSYTTYLAKNRSTTSPVQQHHSWKNRWPSRGPRTSMIQSNQLQDDVTNTPVLTLQY